MHHHLTFAWVCVASPSCFCLGLCCIISRPFAWICVASPSFFCLGQCCIIILLLIGSVLHNHCLPFAWTCVASPSYFCLGLCCITILLLLGSVLHHHLTFAWVCVASSSYPPQRSCRGVYWFHPVRPSVDKSYVVR